MHALITLRIYTVPSLNNNGEFCNYKIFLSLDIYIYNFTHGIRVNIYQQCNKEKKRNFSIQHSQKYSIINKNLL